MIAGDRNATPYPSFLTNLKLSVVLTGLQYQANTTAWGHENIITLHTFEYIAREALLNWWRKATENLTTN